MARKQPTRVVVQKQDSGCGAVFGVLFLVGLAIVYWYVTLTIIAIVVVVALVRASQERERARHKPGPRDPWLNEVAVALADLGFTEVARNTGAQLGGSALDGDIGVEGERLRVYVNLFPDQVRARQAELGLMAKPQVRAAITRGATVITTADRVVYVANGRGTVVDEFRLDEVIRLVGRIAVPPPLQGQPALVCSGATLPNPDALEQLRKLGQLRSAGVLTDAEFAGKKAELLGRL